MRTTTIFQPQYHNIGDDVMGTRPGSIM